MPARDKIAAILGVTTGMIGNSLLVFFWLEWSSGSWADCPNYAFSQKWYPIPPLPVIFLPFTVCIIGFVIGVSQVYATQVRKGSIITAVNWTGIALNSLPAIVTLVLPMLSNLLHLTTAGC